MTPRVGVVVFPGSNCEFDVVEAVRGLGGDAELLWHAQASLGDVDAVVLPGGFAHGDYLRPGAIARFSPVMKAVEAFAAAGGPVIGICNGFQVLCEAGLLPGALQKNAGLKFLCKPVVRPGRDRHHGADRRRARRSASCAFRSTTSRATTRVNRRRWPSYGRTIGSCSATPTIPMGRSTISPASARAGRNVVGLMPHPERACHPMLGSTDGAPLLRSLLVRAGALVA